MHLEQAQKASLASFQEHQRRLEENTSGATSSAQVMAPLTEQTCTVPQAEDPESAQEHDAHTASAKDVDQVDAHSAFVEDVAHVNAHTASVEDVEHVDAPIEHLVLPRSFMHA